LNLTTLEESISHTLILSREVRSMMRSNKNQIGPVWKAPVYNSPTMNWKRGMYAWSTAVLLVRNRLESENDIDGAH
jgi:hypothetical protein